MYAGVQHRATSRSSTSSSRPRSGRPPSVTRSAIQSRHRRSTVSSITGGARRDLARRSLGPNSWQRGLVSAPSVCRRCRVAAWPGLRAERLPPVPEDEVVALVQPILEHLRDVVTGPEHLDFLLAWLAQQVQDPAHHTWRSRPSCRFRSTARARLPTSRCRSRTRRSRTRRSRTRRSRTRRSRTRRSWW